MQSFFVDIALHIPLNRTFTYLVSPELQPFAALGKRVLVPFGNKHLTGIIVGLPATTNVPGLKPITDILDVKPTFSQELLALTKWIAEYYLAPWGEVLRAATPQGFSQESKKIIRLLAQNVDELLQTTKKSAPRQHAILQALKSGETLSFSRLQTTARAKNIHAVIGELQQRGWISVEEEIEQQKAKPKKERIVGFTAGGIDILSDETKRNSYSSKQLLLMDALQKEFPAGTGSIGLTFFLKKNNGSLSSLKTLVKNGVLQISEREVFRRSEYEPDGPPQEITLNTNQHLALN